MKRLLAPIPLAVVACVVALLALLAYGVFAGSEGSEIDEALAQGERPPAPAIELPGLDGKQGSLEDYRGQVVVLNFWASWCDPCREESPLLERFHEDLRQRGGTVVGVDVRDLSDDAREFVREYDLSYPMLRDKDGHGIETFGVVQYPETFVIDRAGRITAVRRGPVDERFMRTEVEPLL